MEQILGSAICVTNRALLSLWIFWFAFFNLAQEMIECYGRQGVKRQRKCYDIDIIDRFLSHPNNPPDWVSIRWIILLEPNYSYLFVCIFLIFNEKKTHLKNVMPHRHVCSVLYLWYSMHSLVLPRAVNNAICLFTYINFTISNIIYYFLVSTYVHLFMFTYKLLTEIAIYFYQLNLEVDKMLVDKIKRTRQWNIESAEMSR